MNQLFISYNYTGKQHGVFYQGFSNMICRKLVYPPSCPEHVEALHELTEDHCIKELGMETATTTILFWKQLNGL